MLSCTSPVQAQMETLQSLAAIEQTVSQYLQEQQITGPYQIEITITSPDPRLRLAACADPLEAFTSPGQRTTGAAVVGVRCSAPVAWTIYVQANVALLKRVLTAGRPLPRGTVLSRADVELVEQDITRLNLGYLSDFKEIDGMVLKRSVASGMVLHAGLLQAPITIHRGEKVTILGQLDGIEVRMEGRAMTDGAKGELIRVRNLSSGRDVEGVVLAPGLVQVRL